VGDRGLGVPAWAVAITGVVPAWAAGIKKLLMALWVLLKNPGLGLDEEFRAEAII